MPRKQNLETKNKYVQLQNKLKFLIKIFLSIKKYSRPLTLTQTLP